MAGATLFSHMGGTVVLPPPGALLTDRVDGGHLIVNPPRAVWERSELTAEELTQWSLLVAATGRAMIDTLPQLEGGCVNYWEAGNWALNERADPPGPKLPRTHRSVHQHIIGRSRSASNPSWKWGQAPIFPTYDDRERWAASFEPLTEAECGRIVAVITNALGSQYATSEMVRIPSLVVFDLAGTTVEDRGQVPQAFLLALADEGIHATAAEIANVRGASKRDAMRQFFPLSPDREQRARSAYEGFRHHLSRLYNDGGIHSIAGAETVFKKLRARGVKVALNTGFDRSITHLLLDALHWSHGVVDAVVCGDDVEKGRPAPDLIRRAMLETGITDPRQVANVGDTTLDLQAGFAAGVRWNVGVLSGAHDGVRMSDGPHTHLISDVSHLNAVWPRIFAGK